MEKAILDRAIKFVNRWEPLVEQGNVGEAQRAREFMRDFYEVFGISRARFQDGFEYRVKVDKRTKRIDSLLPGVLIIEMESQGVKLVDNQDSGYEQAARYAYALNDSDKPKYILACDFSHFYLKNPFNGQTWETTLSEFIKNIDMFNFLVGYEQFAQKEQAKVNGQAAESISHVYRTILTAGVQPNAAALLMTRIVFALFADDAEIFQHKGVFARFLQDTNPDGSDLLLKLNGLFSTLNTPDDNWLGKARHRQFGYINGGLFAMDIAKYTTNLGIQFNHEIRDALINASRFDWSKISPVIFGSMFEGALDPRKRHDLGAHYTSESNIMKVVDSLFMNDLRNELNQAINKSDAGGARTKALTALHQKIANLHFLDPACGSGNFLIVAYRELRRLEHELLEALYPSSYMQTSLTFIQDNVKVEVNQFYGIEIEGYAVSIARVGMWLMDHLMNLEASKIFGNLYRRIPLHAAANIARADALQVDWIHVFDDNNRSGDENEGLSPLSINQLDYILGNPPFNGKSTMTSIQKEDMEKVFSGKVRNWKTLDFVSGWYIKTLEVIQENPHIQASLVSTNSITQGEQAITLWPYLFKNGVHINFAHQTFKWDNNGAAVFVVVIGFGLVAKRTRQLFEYFDVQSLPVLHECPMINEYLQPAPPLLLEKSTKQLSDLPEMNWGSKLTDNQNFLFQRDEALQLVREYPITKDWLHRYYSAKALINNNSRVALYLADASSSEIRSVPPVMKRIQAIKMFREASRKKATQEKASTPALYQEDHVIRGTFLAIPRVSSGNRTYVPMTFLAYPDMVSDAVFEVVGDESLFALLQSKMHMTWLRNVGGRLKGDFRYSNTLVYNTFVLPKLTDTQFEQLTVSGVNILSTREKYFDEKQTLADLYDPLSMPRDLLEAHQKNDKLVDQVYGLINPTESERFVKLSELYHSYVSNDK